MLKINWIDRITNEEVTVGISEKEDFVCEFEGEAQEDYWEPLQKIKYL